MAAASCHACNATTCALCCPARTPTHPPTHARSTASFDGKFGVASLLLCTGSKVSETVNADFSVTQSLVGDATPLRKAPSWMRRPVGATFGFGGRLVSFTHHKAQAVDPATGQPRVVDTAQLSLRQVVTEQELVTRSEAFEGAIQGGNLGTLRAYCAGKVAAAGAGQEAETWQFLSVLFEGDDARRCGGVVLVLVLGWCLVAGGGPSTLRPAGLCSPILAGPCLLVEPARCCPAAQARTNRSPPLFLKHPHKAHLKALLPPPPGRVRVCVCALCGSSLPQGAAGQPGLHRPAGEAAVGRRHGEWGGGRDSRAGAHARRRGWAGWHSRGQGAAVGRGGAGWVRSGEGVGVGLHAGA